MYLSRKKKSVSNFFSVLRHSSRDSSHAVLLHSLLLTKPRPYCSGTDAS
jgi:hypothetical protein